MMQILIPLAALALQASAPPQQPQPTFRARVDQVLVDVIVTDRNDRPITDLTAADFEIRENGRLQRITDFQYVSVPVSTTPLEADTREERAAIALPDVATNAPASPAGRLFVLVIDDLHIIESEIIPVKRIVTDFVTALTPDDEVGVVFTGRSDLGINITRDRARLLAAIDSVRGAMGFGLDALYRLPNGVSEPRLALSHARSLVATLRNTAAALASSGHPRRAVVLVSAGSPLDLNPPINSEEFRWSTIMREDLAGAFETARRSNVPIYTLDPRGHTMPEDAVRGGISAIGQLNLDIGAGTKPPGRAQAAAPAGEDVRAGIAKRIRMQQNFLSSLAINTGGRAFINQSNLARAVSEIMVENGSYYLLAYSPEPLLRDGTFHGIDIRVKRDGVRVRGRDGYVAPGAAGDGADPASNVDAAMSSAINVSGIGLRAVATPVERSAKGVLTMVTLQVTYPLSPGSTAPIDDLLQMKLTALDPEAKVKASAEHAFAFQARPIEAGEVTFLVNGLIELPSRPLTLRMGLASRALGRAGMVQMPIDAPDTSSSKLQMSGIAIGVDGRPEPALGANLIQPLVPFQPTPARAFAAPDTLRIFARLFWESNDMNAELTFGVTGPVDIEPQRVSLSGSADGRRRAAAFSTSLPLDRLTPGDYVLHVDARLPSGQTASRAVPFRVR